MEISIKDLNKDVARLIIGNLESESYKGGYNDGYKIGYREAVRNSKIYFPIGNDGEDLLYFSRDKQKIIDKGFNSIMERLTNPVISDVVYVAKLDGDIQYITTDKYDFKEWKDRNEKLFFSEPINEYCVFFEDEQQLSNTEKIL